MVSLSKNGDSRSTWSLACESVVNLSSVSLTSLTVTELFTNRLWSRLRRMIRAIINGKSLNCFLSLLPANCAF
ncbi:CIC11C00000005649 [Sungouiella intermedia]|uniref:CIC11C00000005649 n=1 Tax=Sungouiella intermedia TaxID=45354 RepID=A0A1L0GR58_9ASCO|nr:CIC11C00000005649 [[Candida] intermedia]